MRWTHLSTSSATELEFYCRVPVPLFLVFIKYWIWLQEKWFSACCVLFIKTGRKKSTSIILLNIFVMVTRAVGRYENPGVPVVIRWAICPPGLDRVKWSAKIRHGTPGPPQGRHPWVMDWNGQQIFSPTLIDNTEARHRQTANFELLGVDWFFIWFTFEFRLILID